MKSPFQADVFAKRFELTLEGGVAGFVEYYDFGDVAIVTHTEIDPAHEGRGLGSQLARHALDYLRSERKSVVPVCGFLAHQMRRHPDFADLLTPECRRIFKI